MRVFRTLIVLLVVWGVIGPPPAGVRLSASPQVSGPTPQALGEAVTGSQPFITIRCRFGDATQIDRPVEPSVFIGGAPFPSMDAYWREASYGAIDLAGSEITPWVNLPNPWSYYIYDRNGDGQADADFARLILGCTAAADPLVDFTRFVGINLIFNRALIGGGAFIAIGNSRYPLTLDGVTKNFRATWYGADDDSSYRSFATMAHEVGHTFGFTHSCVNEASNWDVMCSAAHHYDPTFRLWLPQHPIAYQKYLVGWIPEGRTVHVLRGRTVTVALERLAAPISATAPLMIRIPVPGSTYYFYTVEFRQRVGHDSWLPGDAVIIHQNAPAPDVVDADNNGNANDAGGMWTPGETFTDAARGISVTVHSFNATYATVTVTNGRPLRPGDFNGDGASDVAVYRPSTGTWFVRGMGAVPFGAPGDIPVAADYDRNGVTEMAVFRPSTGVWYIRGFSPLQWGSPNNGDIPVPADYDGDASVDLAIFQPQSGRWTIRGTALGPIDWGGAGDVPVPADYNGDGIADIAVFRPATGVWHIRGYSDIAWGAAGDIPIARDYDGDGTVDVAVFRPSTGIWYIRAGGTMIQIAWGGLGDVPVPGDYNGDGVLDIAIFRPSTGEWWVRGLFGPLMFGGAGDVSATGSVLQ